MKNLQRRTRQPRIGGSMAPEEVSDIVAIQQLKARYAWFADSKYSNKRCRQPKPVFDKAARLQVGCFTNDAVWDGGKEFGRRLVGRAALLRFFQDGPWKFALHYYVAPIIEVRGDSAQAWWRLWQIAIPRGSDEAVFFAAVTKEEYRRERGVWLHSGVSFKHAHFARPSDGPGLNVFASLT